jgi:hypothetical protein
MQAKPFPGQKYGHASGLRSICNPQVPYAGTCPACHVKFGHNPEIKLAVVD